MATNLTALFETKFDGSGLNQARTGFQGWQDGVQKANQASQSVGDNYEALAKKVERPLGRVAFQSLAQSVLMSSGAMQMGTGAASALAGGFQAISQALMFVQPQIAAVGIILLGLVAIYQKVNGASRDSAEAVKKEADEMVKNAEAAKLAAESLRTLGTINEKQYQQLKNSAAQNERDLLTLQKQLSTKKQLIDTEVEALKVQAKGNYEGGKGSFIRLELHDAMVKQSELEKALIAIGTSSNSVAQTQNELLAKQAELRANQETILAQHTASFMNLAQAELALAQVEYERTVLETQYLETMDPKKAESIQRQIDDINRLAQAYDGQISKLKTVAKSEEAVIKARAATFMKYTDAVSSAWEVHGKAIVFNARKFLAEELKLVADQAATALAIAAAKYYGSGNYAMAAVAGAAAIAVRSLGAIGAAKLGAGAGGGDVGDMGETSPGLSPSVGGPEAGPATRQMNMNVYVQGHILGGEKQLGDALVDIINDRVVRDGKTLVATKVYDTGATAPL